MTIKTKILKTSISLVVSLIFLMITAASVSADRIEEEPTTIVYEIPIDDSTSNDLTDDLLISPNPEPLVIAPNSDEIYESGETDNLIISGDTEEKYDISTIVLPGIIMIIVIASLVASLIIFKRKNK